MTPRQRASKLEAVRANLAGEIRAAIATAPCTLRALARASNVSHTVLVQIRRGTFLATPVVARKLADALEQCGAACKRSARQLRKAARRVPTPRTRRKP